MNLIPIKIFVIIMLVFIALSLINDLLKNHFDANFELFRCLEIISIVCSFICLFIEVILVLVRI